nr:reverse transcriptase domain-containing protein [Tanacetum cinerariifolium]
NVTLSKPATTHDAIRMAYNLIDQVVHAKSTRGDDGNKQKWEDHQGVNTDSNNQHHQQNRRQEADKAYAAAPAKRRGYAGNLPLCNRCKLHHTSPCIVRCMNCQNTCHQSKDCMSKAPATGSTTHTSSADGTN